MKKLLFLIALLPSLVFAQKISDLPAASTLGGTEVVAGVQSSTTKKISVNQIAAYVQTFLVGVYQPVLVSGTNIKTINGTSLLGSGNIVISGGGGGGDLISTNNLSDLASAATARTNLGLGTLATQSGTFSGTHSGASSGTNTGDQDLSSYATSSALTSGLAGKQATLVSATNIKTVNGNSLLGSGNVVISGGDLLSTNNLSDLANASTARTNLGLGNLDNTSDVNKPVSTAQAAANALKANKLITLNSQTDNYTLVLTDADTKALLINKATSVTVTVPTNASVAFPVGTYINLIQYGPGTVTISGTPTIRPSSGEATTPGQYSPVGLLKIATDEWLLFNGGTGSAVVDWSTGLNPTGWASTTNRYCYYIDYGKYVFITGAVEGTGTAATTVTLTLPIAPSTLYATGGSGASLVIMCQTQGATAAATNGMLVASGGSTTVNAYTSANGAAFTASQTRIVRFSFMYLK